MIFAALDADSALVLLEERHADELFAVIDADRAHLRAWLPWLDVNTEPAHTRAFIRSSLDGLAAGNGFTVGIRHQGRLVGVCGYHGFDRSNRSTSLGYWLSEPAQGHGLMTRSVRALCRHAFDEREVHRVELRAATANARSRAVAERAGFTLEGIARDAEQLYGRFVDHAVYSRLSTDP